MAIRPFKIDISKETITDLKTRLAQTVWPDEIAMSGWSYGTNLNYIKELMDYWQNQYDWKRQEELLNEYAHFKTNINNLDIHFIHERGKGLNPIPLILTNGWPSTFFELYKMIPMLTDPESYGRPATESFDVIIPSIPGFGFSECPSQPDISVSSVGDMWKELMCDQLGYKRFAAHGSDWGSSIMTRLGLICPDQLIGLHLTAVPGMPHLPGLDSADLTPVEHAYLEQRMNWIRTEGAFGAIQGTKPQTLSYALTDSPVGLAAWVIEKFYTWSDCNQDLANVYTKDELLTNLTIYWVTKTINASMRLYYESFKNPIIMHKDEKIHVPTAIAHFPKDVFHPPKVWAERVFSDIQHWRDMPRGGHFPALENPRLLSEDIRYFFYGICASSSAIVREK